MRNFVTGLVAVAALLAFAPSEAGAYMVNDAHQIYGYGQVLLLLSEDATEGDTVQTAGGENGKTTAFGFKDRRFRSGMKGDLLGGAVYYNVMMESAGGSVKLVDYWFGVRGGAMYAQFGRFRPFITWEESMTSASGLKNIDRDAGLTALTAAFFAQNASSRDLGLKFGFGDPAKDPLSLLFSVTNGSGANMAVGGDVSGGAVYSNAVGDAAYAVGLVAHMGGHGQFTASYAMNKHNGATLAGTELTAIDIDRTVYSVGAEYAIVPQFLWLDGEYAHIKAGSNDFDFPDAEMTAWFVRAGIFLIPTKLELVGRMAKEADKGIVHGAPDHERTTDETEVTLNYYLGEAFKVQMEYATFSPEGESSYNAIRTQFQIKF
ncbi:MAG: hypothetical protein HQK87_00590 [Nitrospinae bacterium]|nr:hypothetical protein [Nitrospinota bacterium]